MTDTDALTERIARILNDEGWTFEGVHEPGEYDECEECRLTVDPIAVRVAREVAAEVRKAKAEALRAWASGVESQLDATASEGIALGEWGRGLRSGVQQARDTADQYETGDQR